jgi:GNAT superfamily N-acetyltransferase
MDAKSEPSAGIIEYSDSREFSTESVVALYRTCGWSAATKPDALHRALLGSHSLFTAWHAGRLVGLGNAISDGHLVVYYSHLLVHPDYQKQGIGSELMRRLSEPYRGFHQHIIVADAEAVGFFRKCGFERAGRTQSMWIYSGHEH